MTIEEKLEAIAKAFNGRDTIPSHMADGLLDILDEAPSEALEMIVDKNIKFLAPLARRRLADLKGDSRV